MGNESFVSAHARFEQDGAFFSNISTSNITRNKRMSRAKTNFFYVFLYSVEQMYAISREAPARPSFPSSRRALARPTLASATGGQPPRKPKRSRRRSGVPGRDEKRKKERKYAQRPKGLSCSARVSSSLDALTCSICQVSTCSAQSPGSTGTSGPRDSISSMPGSV